MSDEYNDHDIDPALLAEFIDESIDFLSEIDNLFIQLEAAPSDLSIVESIFRPIHSIKGNSSFFGFVGVKILSHEMETLLDMVRKGTLSISPPLIGVLLEGVDELKTLLNRCRQGEPEIADQEHFDALVEKVMEQGTGGDDPAVTACTLIITKLEELQGLLESPSDQVQSKLEEALAAARTAVALPGSESTEESRSRWPEELREIIRILAQPIVDLLPDDKSEVVIDNLHKLKGCTQHTIALSELEELIENYATFANSLGFDALLQDIIVSKLRELDIHDPWIVEDAADTTTVPDESPEDSPETTQKSRAVAGEKTMRIPEIHIDTFLSYVGELLVVGDMFNHLNIHVSEEVDSHDFVTSFKLATDTFNVLSDDLQKSIMSIRKVAIKSLFQKIPRIVRDIASTSGKQIEVVMVGEEIQVDKSLIDLLDAPMTHMIRNACDHGVETPEQREAAGKPPGGIVRITCEEEASNITLTVTDDGAGINFDAIRDKAVSIGIVEAGKDLTPDEIIECMFRSGVSTAEEVTDVSGRGVGMDVVKRMIEEAGGKISVSSESGKGSVFEIVLPKSVTTQIMQGFLVEALGQCFVLPMNKIHETSRMDEAEITTLPGEDRCVNRHGKILPLLSLSEALSTNGACKNEPAEDIIVTVARRNGQFGMSVDAVLGVQKVVFREINGLDSESDAIVGGALMGDGKVSLILDLDKLYDEYVHN